MKAEYVNPILEALYSLLQKFAGTDSRRGKLVRIESQVPRGDITIVLPVSGQVTGRILLIMDRKIVLAMGKRMLLGFPVRDIDGLTRDAIMELALRIAADASETLAKREIRASLMHPRLIEGRTTEIPLLAKSALGISIETGDGSIILAVDLT
ncbi:MAG: hypothetical protein CVV64_03175 [Candidatus Wallbacteria bacterium HGW-Wallbacteria-1]|jgi:chemotaxis protein CheX|uniref:Chemotaxis protein CheX n=1 Tax=Candidatus Wallbacteria bacterium HGW-Wallbacteria-1 TaxID=2013854 RepID=A0A2N1PTL7_9BACT|nr:MAG: hypothetical protein CVV64_03175 [Candidatus Wallbacteria bacterium HGW-Wallbacteria-1]